MKKILKKDSEKFVSEVSKGLLAIGAVKLEDAKFSSVKRFSLETKFGALSIGVETENVHGFTVFSCFEDVERAKDKVDCNSNTGKYNTHTSVIPVDVAVELCVNVFERLL